MTGKQITELDSVNVVGANDLVLMRSTSTGTDKKIKATDFINSLGNPALQGFSASMLPVPNNTTIQLQTINGSIIPSYVTGMKVSFIAPANRNSNVKIKIGSLIEVNFVDYQTTQSVDVSTNEYVEAVYITDKFHRVNNAKSLQTIYSTEYKIITVTPSVDQLETLVVLNSAIGLQKTSYYDGMSINFFCFDDTQGRTQLFIDDLGGKYLIENPSVDFSSLPLYNGQMIKATYSSIYDAFIREAYSNQNPAISILNFPPEPTEQQVIDQVIPPVILPPQNILEYEVKNAATNKDYSFTTLKQCVEKILHRYPDGKDSGVKINIKIVDSLNCSALLFNFDTDLSWITLSKDDNVIALNKGSTRGPIFTLKSGSSFFNIKEGTEIQVTNSLEGPNNASTLFHLDNATLNLTNITIRGNANSYYGFHINRNSKVNLTNCEINDFIESVNLHNSDLTMTSCQVNNWGAVGIRTSATFNSTTINLTGCNLKKNGFSSLNDIVCTGSSSANTLRISQTNTKAKCSLGGATEVPPGSDPANYNYVYYTVVGGQN